MEYDGYTSRKPSPLEYDVALLRLRHGIDLTYSHNINSVCWPTISPPVGRQVVVTGWGIKFQGFKQHGKATLLQKVISRHLQTVFNNDEALPSVGLFIDHK